ncbi:hypothetical protein PMAYCL1PPCAC_07110, partial [Pristionchus mayeri]
HAVVLSQANDASSREIHSSQSPSVSEICAECSEQVPRWPMNHMVFFVACCDSFLHYDCAIKRFKQTLMHCGNCGSICRYLESVERQGHCLLDYSEGMKKKGI